MIISNTEYQFTPERMEVTYQENGSGNGIIAALTVRDTRIQFSGSAEIDEFISFLMAVCGEVEKKERLLSRQ